MINLLPTDTRAQLQYARKNTSLSKWLVAFTAALSGVALILIAGNIYLQVTINNYSSDAERIESQLEQQNIEETKKQLEELSNDTNLAINVLSREVLFSKLLRQLGASLPPNVVLQQFQVEEYDGGLTLQAAAANIEAATQLQVNLEDPQNKIFQKADIESISCAASEDNPQYPCSVQVRALLAEDNPYTFIGQGSGGSQ